LRSVARSTTATSSREVRRPRPASAAPPCRWCAPRTARERFAAPNGASAPTRLSFDADIVELLIVTGFAEVWLAKEGHEGRIFINFLNKIDLPLIYIMYGAILAGVDGVIVGAGNPEGLPAICARLARHETVTRNLSVLYAGPSEQFTLTFDPRTVAGGALADAPVARPAFLAIASLEELVQALAASDSLAPDGFIVEHHTAGGHNANPAGPMRKDVEGQPIYGQDDEPDLAIIKGVGIPFWLAGGYGSAAGFQAALAAGAVGVQVGSVFALTEESGMKPEYRSAVFDKLRHGADDASLVKTTLFSPTGFSFKVAQLEGTLSEDEVYEARRRTCDIGLLQQRGFSKPNGDGTRTLFQRCAAAPIGSYVENRGIERNTDERRCLCNGLLASVGLGQVKTVNGEWIEEPAIVTLGNRLDGVRRLSRQGQTPYHAQDVVVDILG
jgi:nitronate monooxygenase